MQKLLRKGKHPPRSHLELVMGPEGEEAEVVVPILDTRRLQPAHPAHPPAHSHWKGQSNEIFYLRFFTDRILSSPLLGF